MKQKNALTRAIGVYASVEVDTLNFGVMAGDRLLLCSDGLYGYLRKGELNSVFEDAARPGRTTPGFDWPINGGGHDNITAVVIAVSGPSDGEHETLTKLTLDTLQTRSCSSS